METRVEKWKLYRNEIINNGFLVKKISNDIKKINDWKVRIDRIDPKILEGIEVNGYITSLLSINNNDFEPQNNIEKILSSVNENELGDILKEIEDLKNISEKEIILDENGKISTKWLKSDLTLSKFSGVRVEIKNINNDIVNYDANANAKIDKIESLEGQLTAVEGVKNIQKFNDDRKHKWFEKWLFYGSLVFVVLALIIVMIIVVIYIDEGKAYVQS